LSAKSLKFAMMEGDLRCGAPGRNLLMLRSNPPSSCF
jgi:hypothetical protein